MTELWRNSHLTVKIIGCLDPFFDGYFAMELALFQSLHVVGLPTL
jgi:hypothetical protein